MKTKVYENDLIKFEKKTNEKENHIKYEKN